MSAKQMERAALRLPYLLAVCGAALFAGIFWQVKSYGHAQMHFDRESNGPVEVRSATLAWKQPILPAQYIQGSCGTCHRQDLPQTPRLNHGRQLLVKFNCIGCHRLQDIDRPVMLGPDLDNVGAKVSREWIYKWLKEPRTLVDAEGNVTVDGVATDPRMPKFQLSEQELRALSAYLSVQHSKSAGLYKFNARAASVMAGGGEAADQGQIRFNQMFCVTCHALSVERGGETKLIGGDIGPELTKVGSKVRPEWLAAWLRNPQSYLQHTRMPQYQWSEKDIHDVTQYILTRLTDADLLKDVPQLGTPTDAEVQLGRRLFVEKGCAECHVIHGVIPQSEFGPDLSAIGMAAGPYLVEVKSARKLAVPLHFVKSNIEKLEIRESVVPRSMIGYVQAKITDPASVTSEAHMPQFHMSQSDLDDVTTALLSMSGPQPPSGSKQNSLVVPRPHPQFHPDGEFAQLYERFKCYQCHSFKGYGGTLAPDLSNEGSRSQRGWLIEFLKDPQTLRPTLTVRMPHFNMTDHDATTIADYLSVALQSPQVNPAAISETAFSPEMAGRGKQLFEEKYKCQSCHTIGSSGGYVGPSLNNAGNWLTPAWIEAWLRDPQILVPGTIEPHHTFNEDEIKDLTAYLLTLKQTQTSGSTTGMAAGGGLQ